mgnify:CR=1 FL=1
MSSMVGTVGLRWSDDEVDLKHATLALPDRLEVLEPTGKRFEPALLDGAFQRARRTRRNGRGMPRAARPVAGCRARECVV